MPWSKAQYACSSTGWRGGVGGVQALLGAQATCCSQTCLLPYSQASQLEWNQSCPCQLSPGQSGADVYRARVVELTGYPKFTQDNRYWPPGERHAAISAIWRFHDAARRSSHWTPRARPQIAILGSALIPPHSKIRRGNYLGGSCLSGLCAQFSQSGGGFTKPNHTNPSPGHSISVRKRKPSL